MRCVNLQIFSIFAAFKADGSPRAPNTPISPCEHPRYLDFLQNVSSDKNPEEIAATKHTGNNNSYVNVDPSTLNFTPPVAPSGMCIPDCNETVSADSARVDCEIAIKEHHDDDTVEASCSDMTKVKPSVVDEVDSALTVRAQETVGMKYDEGHASANSTSILKNTNEASETRVPEYMNLAVNMSHEAAKVLGAIPKKLPAPPVPPRGTIFQLYNFIIY